MANTSAKYDREKAAKRQVTRIHKELKTLLDCTEESQARDGFRVEAPDEDNFKELYGYVLGAPETPYDGAEFAVKINFPEAYPFEPPKIYFLTKIWHPNISSITGAICLDTLSSKWVPSLTIYSCLVTIRALMATPEPNDPQDAIVAKQFLTDHDGFEDTARYWSQEYATKVETKFPGKISVKNSETQHIPEEYDKKMTQLTKHKVPRRQALEVLSSSNWDLAKAFAALEIDPNKSPLKRVSDHKDSKVIKKNRECDTSNTTTISIVLELIPKKLDLLFLYFVHYLYKFYFSSNISS